MEVPQHDDVTVVRPQLGELIGNRHRSLAIAGRCARRRPLIGQDVSQTHDGPIEGPIHVVERYLAADVAASGLDMRLIGMMQAIDQNLAEPGQQLALRAATKLAKIAIRPEHRLLNQVRRTDPPPQPRVELRRGQDGQIVAIERQQAPQLVLVAMARTMEQRFDAGIAGAALGRG